MSAPAGGGGGVGPSAPGPSFALYRATGLGRAFVESLNEMFGEGELSNDQVISSLLTFDRSFTHHLEAKTPANKIDMEGRLANYRFCDSVWTLNLKNAKFSGAEGDIETTHVKVVACEAKSKGKRARR